MEFEDLPTEMILEIFSYLPQDFLEVISRVSRRWKKLALDPSLFTVVCIDRSSADSWKRYREIVERATMLRTLKITAKAANFHIVASASTRLRLLNHLTIPGSGLSDRAMPAFLRRCMSLASVTLWGKHRLTANDVRTLETLPSLKRLVALDRLDIRDDVLHQMCSSCPLLEWLELNTEQISRRDSWDYMAALHHLRVLSVSVICTAGLVRLSKSCPGLTTLEIGTVRDEDSVSMAQALQGFLKLKSLDVIFECGQGWLKRQFRTPPLLERFDVPALVMEEERFVQLVLSFGETLKHVRIDASMLPDESLRPLSFCKKLECLHIKGLKGNTIAISILFQLPKLVSATLFIVADPADAVYQLVSIVNGQDKSPRGKTRLAFYIPCSLLDTHDNIRRAAYAFIDHLASNTSMTTQHILEFKAQCSYSDGLPWLPWKLQTTFPTVSPTLKYLTLSLDDV